jgi:hypothetical protein
MPILELLFTSVFLLLISDPAFSQEGKGWLGVVIRP